MGSNGLPVNWPVKAALKGDHVQDGFTIISLLEDAHVKARNARIKLYGQKELLHRCKTCTCTYKDALGNRVSNICCNYWPQETDMSSAIKSVWVAVMDGVTLGHTCCAVHNCKIPLATSQDRYCPTHRGLSIVCAIKDCSEHVLEGKRTCADPSHQEVERVYV